MKDYALLGLLEFIEILRNEIACTGIDIFRGNIRLVGSVKGAPLSI